MSIEIPKIITDGHNFKQYIFYLIFHLGMVCLHSQTPRQRQRPIKMACVELCGDVHTAQRQRLMQTSIRFYTHFIGISVSVLGSDDEPL